MKLPILVILISSLAFPILFSESLNVKLIFKYEGKCEFSEPNCSKILDELKVRIKSDLNGIGKKEGLLFFDELDDSERHFYTSFQIFMKCVNQEIVLSLSQYKENIDYLRCKINDEECLEKLKDFEASIFERIAFMRLKFGDYKAYLRLTYKSSVDEYPCFSKDLKYMAFISDRASGNRDVYIVNLENFQISRLKWDESGEYFPKFSPDGSKLVFQSTKGGKWTLWIAKLNQPDKPVIEVIEKLNLNVNSYTPFWDRTGLYFSAEKDGKYTMYVLTHNGLEALFTRNIEMFSPFHFENIGILFTMIKKDGDTGIFLYKDGKVTAFEDTPFNEFDPVISKDGKWFMFVSNRNKRFSVWLRSLETGKLYEILPPCDGDMFYPCFLNENTIAFSLYPSKEEPDIWIYNFSSIIEKDGMFEKIRKIITNMKMIFNCLKGGDKL